MTKYFKYDIIFTIIAIIGWGFYGYYVGGDVGSILSTIFIIVVLGLLEISISFDNAIVNAKFLKRLDEKRQKRFLTRWILVAVFGMRILFPIVLVAIFAHVSPREAIHLALSDQAQYSAIITSSHHIIAWFGGAFLMMVGLHFFFDQWKDIHRFRRLEKMFVVVGKIKNIESVIVVGVLLVVMQFLSPWEANQFLVAGLWWVMTYIIINGIGALFWHHDGPDATQLVAKAGFTGFLYLEVLDASFSLDGVIGAFALSTDIFVIAAGLGIGAFFIRSFTFYMFDHGTLNSYRYLEHGAFYAIIALALMMILGLLIDLPEVVVGCVGVAFVLLALYSSWKEKEYLDPWYNKVLRKMGIRNNKFLP